MDGMYHRPTCSMCTCRYHCMYHGHCSCWGMMPELQRWQRRTAPKPTESCSSVIIHKNVSVALRTRLRYRLQTLATDSQQTEKPPIAKDRPQKAHQTKNNFRTLKMYPWGAVMSECHGSKLEVSKEVQKFTQTKHMHHRSNNVTDLKSCAQSRLCTVVYFCFRLKALTIVDQILIDSRYIIQWKPSRCCIANQRAAKITR